MAIWSWNNFFDDTWTLGDCHVKISLLFYNVTLSMVITLTFHFIMLQNGRIYGQNALKSVKTHTYPW